MLTLEKPSHQGWHIAPGVEAARVDSRNVSFSVLADDLMDLAEESPEMHAGEHLNDRQVVPSYLSQLLHRHTKRDGSKAAGRMYGIDVHMQRSVCKLTQVFTGAKSAPAADWVPPPVA